VGVCGGGGIVRTAGVITIGDGVVVYVRDGVDVEGIGVSSCGVGVGVVVGVGCVVGCGGVGGDSRVSCYICVRVVVVFGVGVGVIDISGVYHNA